ncbi:MAG TPA: hypothetical protein VFW05_02130 [Verrucomicrobiae bacterium]|nr:hypothetical protein [Verrucomicrobiae bacterium]
MPKELFRKASIVCSFAVLVGALLWNGCGKESSSGPVNSANPDSPATTNNITATSAKPATVGPGPDEKTCFECNGSGLVACEGKGCKSGRTECPGSCIRLTRGTWRHMNVAGHDPSELWITFKTARGSRSWNQNHVGEVIQYQNGEPVNIGRCPICGGATTVVCSACKGSGKQACNICSGKKFIPATWTPTDNQWFNAQPDLIRLTDGRAILGRIAASSGDERTIVTRDKKILHVQISEIVPKADAADDAAQQ